MRDNDSINSINGTDYIMATAKKPAAKKATTKRPVAKKTVAARPVAKKTTVSRKTSTKDNRDFFSFKVTNESVYWLVLSLCVLALGIWVVNLSDKVNMLYDQIEETQIQESSMVLPSEES